MTHCTLYIYTYIYIHIHIHIYDIIDKLIQLIPFKNPQAGAAGCLSPSQVEPSESAESVTVKPGTQTC